MAHPILSDNEAREFFTTVHDTTFDWTVEQLPALMAELGWTIDDSVTIPGEAAIADVAWDLPQVDVAMTFSDGNVNRFSLRLTSPAKDPASQLAVADAFARFTGFVQDIFGVPGKRVPGDHPALQWRHGAYVLTLTNLVSTISVFWATADFQDAVDKTGTE
ncbi:hypothetical protein ABH935_007106 [Catenulispora sp. GAS73]|uniref:DUF6301 family protein n=1 Tax=Catenulispora sp. GAS73 TaxID=3156269 RepID=UPI003518491E